MAKVPTEDGLDVMSQDTLNQGLKTREFQIISDILSAVRGNRKETAERLGISQRTLRYKLAKMREFGIDIPNPSNYTVGADPA